MPNQKTEELLSALRHSLAHLLAAAVLELYPGSENSIGPAIDNGFYQDFELKNPLSNDDLPRIEKKMKELLKTWTEFKHSETTLEEVRKIFNQNKYKIEMAEELVEKGEKLNLYQSGNFIDLCRGGHVENPSKDILSDSFKLTHIAGAYWRGSEKNKMLTRIYGLAFESKTELDAYIKTQEEAKKRDHRILGKELGIFTFSDEVGAGLPLWLPHGEIIRHELEEWARTTEKEWGYDHVVTPHITKKDLFEISGHLPYYKEDLYSPIDIEGEEYYLKPMNCPFAHMIYKSKPRSYRDLPIRFAEYGQVYRFERSGTLHGLMRARGFCQNDAHIYVKPEEAVEEFIQVLKMHEYYYSTLGVSDWWVVLGIRDPQNLRSKYHGDDAMWETAERLTREALDRAGVKYEIEEGGAAHYGPKADIYIRSVIGKEYAIGTDQLDLYMPERFKLSYTDRDGREKMPYIIHRAPLGSHERMIGFLIEHYAGAFPTWLSPVQVKVIPISEKQSEYAHAVMRELKVHNIRVELDTSNETLGKKIRAWKLEKVPYAVIVGEEEMKSGILTIESRKREKQKLSSEDFALHLMTEIKERKS